MAGVWTSPLDVIVGQALGIQPQEPAFQIPADHATATTFFLEACTELSAKNPHERDRALRFEAAEHKYFYSDNLVSCSVTSSELWFSLSNKDTFLWIYSFEKGNDAHQ